MRMHTVQTWFLEWHRYTEPSVTGVVYLLFPSNRGRAFGLLPNKPQLVLLVGGKPSKPNVVVYRGAWQIRISRTAW
jgi:hypothetical protein